MKSVLLTSLLVSMELTFLTNSSYFVFLTTTLFSSPSLLKSTGTVSNLPIHNLSNLLFKLFKSVSNFPHLSIPNL